MRRFFLLTLALVLIAAACGDDDAADSGASTTSAAVDDDPSEPADVEVVDETTTTSAPDAPGDSVSIPTVSGPVSGGSRGIHFNPMPAGLADEYGYVEEEFFVAGEASSYGAVGELDADGMWEVDVSGSAPYTTRILVRRPADPADANGVVAMEWFNVTSGMDTDPDFGFVHPALLSQGTTWVGVSAQFAGVDGEGLGIPIEGFDPEALKTWDPERYEPLVHPGDEFSFDIFSQAAQALRRPDGEDPLGGVEIEHLVALGESQSASRLVTYVNAIHPRDAIFEGFLIHSRGSSGANFDADAPTPDVAMIRTDLVVPVFQFQSETDVTGRGLAVRQPDTNLIRTWEVAGTAHADQSTLDYGVSSGLVWDPDAIVPDFQSMCGQLNQGPQAQVLRRGFTDFVAWVAGGDPPVEAPQLEIVDGVIVRDDLGLALGGIRTPDVDVPIARHSGEPRPDASVICSLFGATDPFSDEQLNSLYATNDDYVSAVTESSAAAEVAGFLLAEDAAEFIARAEAAEVPPG